MEVAHSLLVQCPYLASGRRDFRQAIKVFLSRADLGLHVDHDCSCSFAGHWSLSAMRSKQRMVLQTRWVQFEAVDTFGGCRQSLRLMWWEDWCLSRLTMDMIALENAVLSLTMILSWPPNHWNHLIGGIWKLHQNGRWSETMGVKTSDSWESLAPELRALVLRRVLQTGSRETGKGRCIVAVGGAGVRRCSCNGRRNKKQHRGTITIRIRCVAVLYSFFFLFFYAHSFPCCDPRTTGCHGSSAAVRVEEERELLLPFPKLSKLRVSSPRSS